MEEINIAKEIGKRIRAERKRRHFSQEALAFEASMHPSYLGCMERGEKCPTVETLYKISTALHIPLASLLTFDTAYPQCSEDSRLLEALATLPPEQRAKLVAAFCEIIAAAKQDCSDE